MSPIEKFADNAFAVAREGRLASDAAERLQLLNQASRTDNSEAYVRALVDAKKKQMREMILARAAADIEAHTLYSRPCDRRAEQSFERAATQIGGGTLAALHGDLRLMEMRTRRPLNSPAGYREREIGAGLRLSVNEGLLMMRRQTNTLQMANRQSQPETPAAKLDGLSEPAVELASVARDRRKKRGRPSIVPDERKAEAVRLKQGGASNRALAGLLYGTQRPNAQQVKNVPTILRYYRQRIRII